MLNFQFLVVKFFIYLNTCVFIMLTYQICRIEEQINRTTTFHILICNLLLKLEIY